MSVLKMKIDDVITNIYNEVKRRCELPSNVYGIGAWDHHIIGASIAEKFLIKVGYPKDKIDLVKKCILNHRGSKLMEKTSPEEVCIADCDAMAHFYSVPSLLSMVYREKKLGIDEGSKFVLDKLERSYNKMSDRGKQLVKKQYDSAKDILEPLDLKL